MRELSLFTGAGGGVLGSKLLGWETIGYVEWDTYCQKVIAARIADGHLPIAPIFGDVREFILSGAADQYRGFADVVSGGFPCQPFSVAGKRAGADDHRNMWPATLSVIQAVRPQYVFLENVPGLLAARSYRCICGWPDRWRGTHRDSGSQEERNQSLLCRGHSRNVPEGQADTGGDDAGTRRHDDAWTQEDDGVGSGIEVAYRWGRGDSLPAQGASVPDAQDARISYRTRVGRVDRIAGDTYEWDAYVDGTGESDGEEPEEPDTRTEPEGAGCPACGRRLVQTDANAVWYFGEILADLAESGYDARWRILSAAELGAPHKRDRLWIVASHTDSRHGNRRAESRAKQYTSGLAMDGTQWHVAHTNSRRCEQCHQDERPISVAHQNSADVPHANGAGRKEQRWPVPGGEFLAASKLGGWWEVEP